MGGASQQLRFELAGIDVRVDCLVSGDDVTLDLEVEGRRYQASGDRVRSARTDIGKLVMMDLRPEITHRWKRSPSCCRGSSSTRTASTSGRCAPSWSAAWELTKPAQPGDRDDLRLELTIRKLAGAAREERQTRLAPATRSGSDGPTEKQPVKRVTSYKEESQIVYDTVTILPNNVAAVVELTPSPLDPSEPE